MHRRCAFAAIALTAAAALAGCTTSPADYQPHPAAEARTYAPWTAGEDDAYRIAAGDELALKFVVDADLNATAVVGPDGGVVLPLVSSVPIAGLTVPQANSVLTRRYAAVLRNPQVQVLVQTYGANQVYVLGEVKTPGVFNVKGRLTVAQAVATAGGLLDTARTGKIVLLRQRPGEARPLVRIIDLKTLTRRGFDNDPGPVLAGDVIFAPKTRIAEVDVVVDQYVNRVIPSIAPNIAFELQNGNN